MEFNRRVARLKLISSLIYAASIYFWKGKERRQQDHEVPGQHPTTKLVWLLSNFMVKWVNATAVF